MGDTFRVSSCPFWSTVLQCGARLLCLGVCLWVTMFIVDLWRYFVSRIRSGVTRCTLLMVLYVDRICQCGLREVLWSYIGTLMRRVAAEPRRQLDFYSPLGVPLERSCWPCIRWCGTGGFQEQVQCFFIGLICSIPTIVFYYFSLSVLPVSRLVLWGWGLRTDKV